jgi:hypothetical protein
MNTTEPRRLVSRSPCSGKESAVRSAEIWGLRGEKVLLSAGAGRRRSDMLGFRSCAVCSSVRPGSSRLMAPGTAQTWTPGDAEGDLDGGMA